MWLYNSGPALNDDGCINAAKGKVVTLQILTITLAGFMQDEIQRATIRVWFIQV